MHPTGLYIHLPFCASKCAYCDFNSIVAEEALRRDYLAALLQEIVRCGKQYTARLFVTVYFGGGTPTLYAPEELCRLLQSVREHLCVAPDAEITIEANPGTITAEGLALLREQGFNRLSLGIQSFRDEELRWLGRGHDVRQARAAIAAARAAGFDNLSLDLIHSFPKQRLESWQQTLEEALAWQPEHLSCYGLQIAPGTALYAHWQKGEIAPLEETQAEKIYLFTHERLAAAGYEHYEISNYCRPGYRCRHNENYWRNGDYVGIGAGAASHLRGLRWKSESDVRRWTKCVLAGILPPTEEREQLAPAQQAIETLMLALRMSEGLELRRFCEDFGLDYGEYERRVRRLEKAGLVLFKQGRLSLTAPRGFLLHSEIVRRLL